MTPQIATCELSCDVTRDNISFPSTCQQACLPKQIFLRRAADILLQDVDIIHRSNLSVRIKHCIETTVTMSLRQEVRQTILRSIKFLFILPVPLRKKSLLQLKHYLNCELYVPWIWILGLRSGFKCVMV